MCIDVYENDEGEFAVPKVDDMHRNCIFEKPEVFLCLVLHEYGHYLNGDLDATNRTNQEIQEERMRCIIEGRVMDEEKKADEFAALHVGKSTFMSTMNYLIRKRRERADRDMQLAIREFELRKKAVRDMFLNMEQS